jgi:hypothetical protein
VANFVVAAPVAEMSCTFTTSGVRRSLLETTPARTGLSIVEKARITSAPPVRGARRSRDPKNDPS